MAGVLAAVTGWLLFAALVGSIGAVVVRWTVVPRVTVVHGPSRAWLDNGVARLGRAAGALLPLALVLFFFRQLYEFRDPFSPLRDEAILLLTRTPWGRTWTVAMVGSLVAAVGFFWARSGRRVGWWIATPVVLALGAFPALTGHAAGEGPLRNLTLALDTLHVWAASGWVGGLAVVLLLEAQWLRSPEAPASLLPWLVPVFSPVAIVCVAVLVGTGLFASWMHLPSLGALITTGYGRTLSLKVLLVGAVLGLGALNWKRLTPKLGEAGGNDALRRAATTELLLAQVVLLVTAILVRMSPMDH